MREKAETEDFITSREMRSLEMNAEYFGVSRLALMENAGHAVAWEIASRSKPSKTVALFCGLGGNGGDGLVAARHLSSLGFKVSVVLSGRGEEISDRAAQENWNVLKSLANTVTMQEIADSTLISDVAADIVVDALLGTGTKGKLRPPILQLVKKINQTKAFRVSVDVPTGIDADTGEVLSDAVNADLTITFHRAKNGLLQAKQYVGKLTVRSIGLPMEFESYAGPGDVLLVTKERPLEAHKGDFGRLLIIGGSETYFGAPALAALGAMRTGADLVYVAAPVKTALAISSMSPDIITVKLAGENLNLENMLELEQQIGRADAVVLGPGLGMHPETSKAVKALLKAVETAKKPLLLDADGLKVFAKVKQSFKIPLVLTPHAGEFVTLTGNKLSEDLTCKIEDVRRLASQLEAVVLLKGATDIISDGKRVKLNFSGNPGMTVGGTGDVLSGIIGCFLAQRANAFEAAVAGAFVNGAAGDFAKTEKGYHIVASDLVDWIPRVLNNPMDHAQVYRFGRTC